MAIKAVLDEAQFGELEESAKALYAQGEDGKFILDVDGVDDHPKVRSLKSGHARSKQERDVEKGKRQDLERRFGKLATIAEDLDLSDAEEERLEALLPYLKGEADLPAADDNGSGKGKPNGNNIDIEKIKLNARKPLERERDEAVQRAEKAETQLQGLVIDSALADGLSAIKVTDPDYREALKFKFRNSVKVVEGDDGVPVAVIDGDYGEQPVDKYLKEWANTDNAKKFMDGSGNSGGGNRGNPGNGKIKNPWSPENWSEDEQARIYRQQGRDVAQRMAAEHGKKVL